MYKLLTICSRKKVVLSANIFYNNDHTINHEAYAEEGHVGQHNLEHLHNKPQL